MARVEEAHRYGNQVLPRGVTIDPEVAKAILVPESELLPRVVFRGDVRVARHKDHMVLGPFGDRSPPDYLSVTFRPALQITTGCFTYGLAAFGEEVADKTGIARMEYDAAIRFIREIAAIRQIA